MIKTQMRSYLVRQSTIVIEIHLNEIVLQFIFDRCLYLVILVENHKNKGKEKGDEKESVGSVHEAHDDVIIRPGDYRVQVQLLEAKDIIPAKGAGMFMFTNNQGS